jgi:proteasome beta subunit
MTLVIALKCSDGVLMTSDSQATDMVGIRFPTEKIFQVTSRAVGAGSGASNIITDVQSELERQRETLEASPNVQRSVSALAKPIMETHYNGFIQRVPNFLPSSPATSFLLCGMSGAEPWIAEIDPQNQLTDYTPRGFHAIGSGAPFALMANALLAHFETHAHDLDYGKLVAYRTIEAVIEVSAAGVGFPVRMWCIDEGACLEVDQDELRHLRELSGGWQQAEKEALLDFLSGGDSDIAEPIPPVKRTS